jgi:ABC-type branched-subunit amino acid transport system substrate-binding protein
MRRLLPLMLFCVLSAPGLGVATDAETLRLGEAMYRRGVLPSGQPMKAYVQGDIQLSGEMTTCANCHRRSGLGSLEGTVLTPPTNGARLYAPLQGIADIPGPTMKSSMFKNPPRPAYTDASLANALRNGIDPTGRRLNETMPRYRLDDKAMGIMILYLKSLSAENSPGVTGDEIRFATIVGGDVAPREKEAWLLPLEAFFREEWNDRLPVITRMAAGRPYRKAGLDVWELKGPPASWGGQLEALYRQKPVFALLGGLASGSWAPVHQFCERNAIPCILPLTDLPVVSATDWYTLYYSKGFYQEGEAAAKFLTRVFTLAPDKPVVQLFRDEERGRALARGFADTWKRLGKAPLKERVLPAAGTIGEHFWRDVVRQYPNAVLLAWLDPADLAGIGALTEPGKSPSTLFVSATMLGSRFTPLPDKVRDFTFITWPTRLPGDEEYSRLIVANWLKNRKVPVADMSISAGAYVLTRLLSNALLDMGGDYYRDFFLELLENEIDQASTSVTYPLLSFGPGQRYASKGCYVVTITKGQSPKVIRQSDWVIY